MMSRNVLESLIPVTKEDISYVRSGSDLRIVVNNPGARGTIVIKDYFSIMYNQPEGEDMVSLLLADKDTGWEDFKTFISSNMYDPNYCTSNNLVHILKNAELLGPSNTDNNNISNAVTSVFKDAQEKDPTGSILTTLGVTDPNYRRAITVSDTYFEENIYGGRGNDKITSVGRGDNIYAREGNNTVNILNNANNVYIESGRGKDRISVGDNADGVTIEDLGGNNTISIGKNSGSYSRTPSMEGGMFIESYGVNVNTGAGSSKISIGNDCHGAFVTNDEFNSKSNDSISIGDNANHIKVLSGDGNDTVKIGDRCQGGTIDASTGSNNITVGKYSSNLTINTGEKISSKDANKITIGNSSNSITINTQDTNDTIVIGSKVNASIDAGAGNNKITIGSKSDTYVTLDKGNNTISSSGKINTFAFTDNGDNISNSTITVAKGSENRLYLNNVDVDDLFYVYNKNNLIIGHQNDGQNASYITVKNFNTKAYANTDLFITSSDLYDSNELKIEKMIYDFSSNRRAQTINVGDDFSKKEIIGGRASDRIYVSKGETTVKAQDGRVDTIYADKSNGFDINSDKLNIIGDAGDRLEITGQDARELIVSFDITLNDSYENGYVLDDNKMYVGDENLRSVCVENMSAIEYNGRTYNTAAIDEISENVAGWLESKGFTSTSEVFTGNDVNAKNELTELYAQAETQIWV